MEHYNNHRNQLERLHDRHKRLSLEVYDHLSKNEEKEMIAAHKKLKEAEKELTLFKEKLYAK